jgi:transaldolase
MNNLLAIEKLGQSIWLDYISRPLIEKGELLSMIENDHVKGVTSNPSIFEKAISKSADYHQAIAKSGQNDANKLYEMLAIKDIKDACDLLRPTYDRSNGFDGYASLEVSPHLADDHEKTIEEGLRLWHEVSRPNLMIKVPGTMEGFKAIRHLIGQGVNVNVTLLFSPQSYENAAVAYLMGLKDRVLANQPIDKIHSVASFFVSRIDSKVDKLLEAKGGEALDLLGKIAIANAKVAYLKCEEIYQSELAESLLKKGANPQRLLWASTSTKNKNYSDVLYVESLIAKNTVNTLPLETLETFRTKGDPHAMSDIACGPKMMAKLSDLGIDFDKCCQELLSEGIKLFTDAFDQLIKAVLEQMKKGFNQ